MHVSGRRLNWGGLRNGARMSAVGKPISKINKLLRSATNINLDVFKHVNQATRKIPEFAIIAHGVQDFNFSDTTRQKPVLNHGCDIVSKKPFKNSNQGQDGEIIELAFR